MNALKTLMMLIRALGVVALVAVVYWTMFPGSMREWFAWVRPDASQETLVQQAAVQPAAQAATPPVTPAQAPAAAAPSSPASAPAPESAPAATPKLAAGKAPAKTPKASKSQAAVARWLGSKYGVSPAALEVLVVEADRLSKQYGFSSNLLMAVMAIESNFHPYIQSEAGAQGLMQVMPKIHAARYEKFGGKAAAFLDPVVSLKVGAEILRDCRKLRNGSETEALRFYFGGGAASDGYIDKVRAEQRLLDKVAAEART